MRFLFFPFPPPWTELVSVPEDSLSVWEADRAELFPEERERLRVRLPFLVRVLERLLVEDSSLGRVTSVPVGGAILLYLKEKESMRGFLDSKGGITNDRSLISRQAFASPQLVETGAQCLLSSKV